MSAGAKLMAAVIRRPIQDNLARTRAQSAPGEPLEAHQIPPAVTDDDADIRVFPDVEDIKAILDRIGRRRESPSHRLVMRL